MSLDRLAQLTGSGWRGAGPSTGSTYTKYNIAEVDVRTMIKYKQTQSK